MRQDPRVLLKWLSTGKRTVGANFAACFPLVIVIDRSWDRLRDLNPGPNCQGGGAVSIRSGHMGGIDRNGIATITPLNPGAAV